MQENSRLVFALFGLDCLPFAIDQICFSVSQGCSSTSRAFTDLPEVCPNCSNKLVISRGPSTDAYPSGQNRMECRTCPYQYFLERPFDDSRSMKRKEVEDVLGGDNAWENVDKAEGALPSFNKFVFKQMSSLGH